MRGAARPRSFAPPGSPPEIIGRKRIEQCAARWAAPNAGEPDTGAQRRLLPYPWDYAPSSNRLRADDPVKARIRRLEQRVARLEHLLCLDVIHPA